MDDELKTSEIPAGYENSVEAGPGGWPVWKKPDSPNVPLCPGEDCTATYQDEPLDRYHALECPSCGAVGCEACIMPMRGSLCWNCEDESRGGQDF